MNTFDALEDWIETRNQRGTKTLGFVPTMGNLHEGHLSLIRQSQAENDETIVSIFVNQTQFNNKDDYERYPRTLDADLTHLRNAGVDYCLIPQMNDMYPDGYRFQIHETTHHERLEGKHRPGHFTGMLTVVMKLLNLVSPTRAYFGEKDFEQLQYIKEMVHAFFMKMEIIGCPTRRETSGLALSSRNNRLTREGRKKADTFAGLFLKAPSLEEAKEALSAFDVEYLEEAHQRRFVAVNIDGVRLIDNIEI